MYLESTLDSFSEIKSQYSDDKLKNSVTCLRCMRVVLFIVLITWDTWLGLGCQGLRLMKQGTVDTMWLTGILLRCYSTLPTTNMFLTLTSLGEKSIKKRQWTKPVITKDNMSIHIVFGWFFPVEEDPILCISIHWFNVHGSRIIDGNLSICTAAQPNKKPKQPIQSYITLFHLENKASSGKWPKKMEGAL